jgi:hypothetical protein
MSDNNDNDPESDESERTDGPTDNHEWGENTKQAHPNYPLASTDKTPRGWHNKHTDADEIRRFHSIPRFDLGDFKKYEAPYANCLVHTVDGKYFGHVGGTNALAVGEKGSGKSTLGLHISTRLIDDAVRIPGWAHPDDDVPDDGAETVSIDPDAVVWRGQPAASEWLPLKKWTVLHPPANADIEATWESNDMRNTQKQAADLADEVREVRYYEDPIDLNKSLEVGTFNVVYPDPSFTGCEEIMRDSDYCPEPVPFTPAWKAGGGDEVTPLVHWWFAYLTARLEYGPYDWTAVVFDEAADLAPQGARADKNDTYTKVKTLRKVMAQSRKHYLTLLMFCHHEQNVHSKVRRTFNWRINMPDGTANPCDNNNDNPPVGYSQIPMLADMMSDKPVGYGLFWNETNFTRFRWDDVPEFPEDESRWLKISLSKPTASGGQQVVPPATAQRTSD